MGPDDDLRGDIESAFNGSESGESVPPTPESVPPTPEPVTPPAPVAPAEDSGTQRDALGRFVKKDTAPAAGTPAASVPAVPVAGQQPTGAVLPIPPAPPPVITPPAGWGPAVREHWATLPPAVQEYIVTREQQMQRWANDTAPLRNAGEQFLRAIQPYQMAIQAEGVDPITAVRNLMQVGQTLRFGTPSEKAEMVAQVIQAYGVDIQTLDGVLAGVAPPPGQQPQINVQAEVQRALQPLMQGLQQRQQWEVQQTNEQARQELIGFATDKAHEFIDDVRIIMADLIEVAERQGYNLPLQDAYDRACALHPEVAKVIMARQQGVNAQKLTQNAQRAKAAAVSVRGAAPVGNPGGPEPSSLRESIEAAIDAHTRV